MASEIQLKLMVGKVKHLTPHQLNISAPVCMDTQVHGPKKVGAHFPLTYMSMTPTVP